ncbi:hypothetical protein BC939DRAFT_447371 [Gamsiella multidivaricata]|uniref:uncharacterized protein n=1 Tax=Gamsiella multidivaricata TaxID=101098 RepID=UPI00221F3E10|nr:uncharacterized protein BC939DRAFT_447371 [Gamsiella multidivaricata]KAI7825971.1 hypothetical protein BC939DRAFT_447371 [Gamsiella multidivaricata]
MFISSGKEKGEKGMKNSCATASGSAMEGKDGERLHYLHKSPVARATAKITCTVHLRVTDSLIASRIRRQKVGDLERFNLVVVRVKIGVCNSLIKVKRSTPTEIVALAVLIVVECRAKSIRRANVQVEELERRCPSYGLHVQIDTPLVCCDGADDTSGLKFFFLPEPNIVPRDLTLEQQSNDSNEKNAERRRHVCRIEQRRGKD